MISLGKKYRTRDGREVRLYAVDGGDPYPIHGAIAYVDGYQMRQWTSKGLFQINTLNDKDDLVEIKLRIKRMYWLNLYANVKWGSLNASKEDADMRSADDMDRIACVKIEIDCEEGEGLEE